MCARCASLLLLAACGWSEQRFEVVGIERLCEEAAACAGTYETQVCIDKLRLADRSQCTYDEKAAGDCVSGLDEAACVPYGPFEVKQLEIPEPCVAAYDCDWLDGLTLE
jgi:hypothetical protein